MEISKFTIRVYGLLLNQNQEVLLVHEKMPHLHFTKFPGGGLELGEGTRDCLAREFMEETGLEVEVKEHLYTTDFFQASAFKNGDQLIAIYYRVEPKNLDAEIDLNEKEITINGKVETLRFFWAASKDFDLNQLTFPIDKIVARKFLLGQ
ncbi:MAG: NUDIX hydrolase [Bacteroidia bacterium]|nr:NUDIX hydrolase [Bacteroidia bacterium]MCF8427991.1 NUDIX hydrolase [Bacteroidia bacterium]MCF8445715.1 NUDIX hydrolase [Bacteroidia bacterium]